MGCLLPVDNCFAGDDNLRISATFYTAKTMIRCDTKEKFNVDSTAESVQHNLAHVARKKYEKEVTKTNKRQCPVSSVQVQDP